MRKFVRLGIEPDRTIYRVQADESKYEDFTKDFSITSSAEVSKEESEEGVVIEMVKEASSKYNSKDIVDDSELTKLEQTVAEKLLHLEINERAKLDEMLYGEDIFAW